MSHCITEICNEAITERYIHAIHGDAELIGFALPLGSRPKDAARFGAQLSNTGSKGCCQGSTRTNTRQQQEWRTNELGQMPTRARRVTQHSPGPWGFYWPLAQSVALGPERTILGQSPCVRMCVALGPTLGPGPVRWGREAPPVVLATRPCGDVPCVRKVRARSRKRPASSRALHKLKAKDIK